MKKLALINEKTQPTEFSPYKIPKEGDFVIARLNSNTYSLCYVFRSTEQSGLQMVSLDRKQYHWMHFQPQVWPKDSFQIIEPSAYFTLESEP